jgi:alpha-tubulin suppressor-like RCC1 family protein
VNSSAGPTCLAKGGCGVDRAQAVTVGGGDAGSFACTLTASANVQCWGKNASGQLGTASNADSLSPANVVDLGLRDPLARVIAIGAGDGFACALAKGGYVSCWGHNAEGQLGNGDGKDSNIPTPTPVTANGATALAVGAHHACEIVNGTVGCWGQNTSGAVGDGTTQNRYVVVSVSTSATAVVAGDAFTCALGLDGRVACWGDNTYGQLGDGTTKDHHGPVVLNGIDGVTKLVASAKSVCATTLSQGVLCWGDNLNGEFGTNTRSIEVNPTPPAAGPKIFTPCAHQACGLAGLSSALQCWGSNAHGEVGDGTKLDRLTPVTVGGGMLFTAAAGGPSSTCGVSDHGQIFCWGANTDGQLGTGDTTERLTPSPVVGYP